MVEWGEGWGGVVSQTFFFSSFWIFPRPFGFLLGFLGFLQAFWYSLGKEPAVAKASQEQRAAAKGSQEAPIGIL